MNKTICTFGKKNVCVSNNEYSINSKCTKIEHIKGSSYQRKSVDYKSVNTPRDERRI